MNYINTKIPFNKEYSDLLGVAIYCFAYYEWNIIYIMEYLDAGFVYKYCRGKSLTSWKVEEKFEKILNNPKTDFSKVSKQEINDSIVVFKKLIVKRNALIHAHPCTDKDGSQILNYQTKFSKPLPDMKRTEEEIGSIISEIDKVNCEISILLDRLRK